MSTTPSWTPADDADDEFPSLEQIMRAEEALPRTEPTGGGDRTTLLPAEFNEQTARYFPHLLDGISLDDLRPDLFPEDRILAELIVARDRMQGILHPHLEKKLTAHW